MCEREREINVKSVNNKSESDAWVKANIPSWKERGRLFAAWEWRIKIVGRRAGCFRLAGGDVVPFHRFIVASGVRRQFTNHVPSIYPKLRSRFMTNNNSFFFLSPKNIEKGDRIHTNTPRLSI